MAVEFVEGGEKALGKRGSFDSTLVLIQSEVQLH